MGIPQAILSRVFDPFFSTKQKGSGLGLATAYSIISKHQGYTGIESELGKGTTVEILLPAADGEAIQNDGCTDTVHRGTGRILIMDDEAFIRDILGKMLSSMGYEVVTAADGQEALRLHFDARSAGKPFKAVIFLT